MAIRRVSCSLSPELVEALDRIAKRRGDDRSRLMETLLREHPAVAEDVYAHRPYEHGAPPETVRPQGGVGTTAAARARVQWETVGGKKRRIG